MFEMGNNLNAAYIITVCGLVDNLVTEIYIQFFFTILFLYKNGECIRYRIIYKSYPRLYTAQYRSSHFITCKIN